MSNGAGPGADKAVKHAPTCSTQFHHDGPCNCGVGGKRADTYFKFTATAGEHRRLDGQLCTVVRELEIGKEVDEECAPMYAVRFEDGTEIHAFDDELRSEINGASPSSVSSSLEK